MDVPGCGSWEVVVVVSGCADAGVVDGSGCSVTVGFGVGGATVVLLTGGRLMVVLGAGGGRVGGVVALAVALDEAEMDELRIAPANETQLQSEAS